MLTSFTQIENSPAYIRLVSEYVACSISEELRLHQQRKWTFSAYLIPIRTVSEIHISTMLQAPASRNFIFRRFHFWEKLRYEVSQDVARRQCDFERRYSHVWDEMYLKKNENYRIWKPPLYGLYWLCFYTRFLVISLVVFKALKLTLLWF